MMVVEDAHKQHMEALCKIEENRVAAPTFGHKPRPIVREWSLEDFLKRYLVKFGGKTSPDTADQWLKDMDRIFDAKMCLVESRLAFTVYMLTGEVEHWWINMKSIMEERGELVTWEASRGKFLFEYFLNNVRYAKEMEFLQLTQGENSVT